MWNPDDLGILWAEHTSPLASPLPPATFAQAAAFGVGSRVTVAGWGVNRIQGNRGYLPRKVKQYAATVRSMEALATAPYPAPDDPTALAPSLPFGG